MAGLYGLEAEESVDFHDERTILQIWKSSHDRVALVGVDDEQFAAGQVFPAEAKVAAERTVARAELEQRTREHSRREPVVGSRPDQCRPEISGWQFHVVDRDARFNRPLFEDRDAGGGVAVRGEGSVVERPSLQ